MGILKEWFCDHEWDRHGTFKVCEDCDKFVTTDEYRDCDHEWDYGEIHTFRNRELRYNEYGYFVVENDVQSKKCESCGYTENEMKEKRKVYFKIRERVPQ